MPPKADGAEGNKSTATTNLFRLFSSIWRFPLRN
ncbi:hypothetical protein SLEP1_g3301 [Rubroshorea leprosula]|uniref:Uncharacterized protein n=1 Tax=Rubroshorea leprosula TaxID=152421 RepID=A0AAV5HUB1_9ROSI|nr:hypothetical protein SLEP1_g3301 [Rubroshorea leprosula]